MRRTSPMGIQHTSRHALRSHSQGSGGSARRITRRSFVAGLPLPPRPVLRTSPTAQAESPPANAPPLTVSRLRRPGSPGRTGPGLTRRRTRAGPLRSYPGRRGPVHAAGAPRRRPRQAGAAVRRSPSEKRPAYSGLRTRASAVRPGRHRGGRGRPVGGAPPRRGGSERGGIWVEAASSESREFSSVWRGVDPEQRTPGRVKAGGCGAASRRPHCFPSRGPAPRRSRR